MADIRKRHSAAIKAKVALEMLREKKTAAEIATRYSVHPSQVTKWKQDVIKRLPEIFESKSRQGEWVGIGLLDSLYQQIGKLQVELEWLKKKSGLGTN